MNRIEDLINSMVDSHREYDHLRIFLHREHTNRKPEFGRKFLFVSEDSFGLVKLNDISVDEKCINLVLEDAFTGLSGTFSIAMSDKSTKFLLIAWEDVLDIVAQTNTSKDN